MDLRDLSRCSEPPSALGGPAPSPDWPFPHRTAILCNRSRLGLHVVIPDLAPRYGASLEWWFVHGRFETENRRQRHFMCSVFRQASRAEDDDGHMLLLSSFDDAERKHTVRSEVSPELVDHFLRDAPGELQGAGISQNLVQAFTTEIARGGVPSPIRLSDRAVSMAEDRLGIVWDDIHLPGAARWRPRAGLLHAGRWRRLRTDGDAFGIVAP